MVRKSAFLDIAEALERGPLPRPERLTVHTTSDVMRRIQGLADQHGWKVSEVGHVLVRVGLDALEARARVIRTSVQDAMREGARSERLTVHITSDVMLRIQGLTDRHGWKAPEIGHVLVRAGLDVLEAKARVTHVSPWDTMREQNQN